MTVSVLVPWTPGCPHREAAWAWAQTRYDAAYEVVEGRCSDGPYNRSEAILNAAMRSSGDVLVIADADVWCDPTDAVEAVAEHGWAVPHNLIHRLSPESTERVLAGEDWHGLPLSQDNPQDRRPYRGNPTGTLVVMRRDVLFDVPPDPRFVGWGQEDVAWSLALHTLIGKPWRGSADLVHLWHPAQPRKTRVVGNLDSLALYRRYQKAKGRPKAMRALLDEALVSA